MVLPLLLLLLLPASQAYVLTWTFPYNPSLVPLAWARPNQAIQLHLTLDTDEEIAHLKSYNVLEHGKYQDPWNSFTFIRTSDTKFDVMEPQLVPAAEGTHDLLYTGNFTVQIKVSCSDGVQCNGMERLVLNTKTKNLACQAAKTKLCDDKNTCTKDTCFADGRCSFSKLPKMACKKCKSSKCKTRCPTSRKCGFDGCFGECGTCPKKGNTVCASGKCIVDDHRLGTCMNPISLHPDFRDVKYIGVVRKQVPLQLALDMVIPRCERDDKWFSKSPEIIYRLDLPRTSTFTGLEVRTRSRFPDGREPRYSWSTLVIIEYDPRNNGAGMTPEQLCLGSTFKQETQWACQSGDDDFTGWSAPATWMLRSGFTYFIVVERELTKDVDVEVQFRLVAECTPNCHNKQCGPSGCPGVNCGDCEGETPVCLAETGTCEAPRSMALMAAAAPAAVCNPMLPRCTHIVNRSVKHGCSANKFCSAQCTCVGVTQKLPDLALLPFEVVVDDSFVIDPEKDACAFEEGCLAGTGARRLLRFFTYVMNQGNAPFVVPNPPEKYPLLFEFAKCHGHYHVLDFLQYELVADNGTVVKLGEKRSFCLMDMYQVSDRPDAPCNPVYTCEKQGLSVGWNDVYDDELDCQYIDATGIPEGSYTVRQCVNPKQRYMETTYENNCAEARVTLGPRRIPKSTESPTAPGRLVYCPEQCLEHWRSDKYCDPECNTVGCGWDGGDCDAQRTCDEGCELQLLGDGKCDAKCNTVKCSFDFGDCQ